MLLAFSTTIAVSFFWSGGGASEKEGLVAEHPYKYAAGLLQGWASPKVPKQQLAFGQKLRHLVPETDERFRSFDALAEELSEQPGSDQWVATNPTITRTESGYVVLAKLSDWQLCTWDMRGPPVKFSPSAKRKGEVSTRLAIQAFDLALKPLGPAALLDVDQATNEKYGCNDPLLRDGIEDPKVVVLDGNATAWVMLALAGRGQSGPCKFHLAFSPLALSSSSPELASSSFVELKFSEAQYANVLPPFVYTKKGYQKNWNPFVHNGEIMQVYSFDPHVILKPDLVSGQTVVAHSSFLSEASRREVHASFFQSDWKQKGKEIHGGTNIIHLPEKKLYMGIMRVFYSRTQYTSFFYSFQDEPPFAVQAVSTEFCISRSRQPEAKKRKKKHFHCETLQIMMGLAMDAESEHFLVTYGVNDCDARLAKIKAKKVFAMMHEVETAAADGPSKGGGRSEL